MRTLPLVLLLGCSGSSTITVTAKVTDYATGAPVGGARIVFMDGDGTTHTNATDDTGSVTGPLAADGSVWHNRFQSDPNEGADYVVFADLKDGDTVVFGAATEVRPPTVATMTVVANAPAHPPDNVVLVTTNCGDGGIGGSVGFDARCHGVADVLVTLTTLSGQALQYAFLPATTIVNGGTITVDPSAWHPADPVSITVSTAGTQPTSLLNDFRISIPGLPSGATLSGALPLVGSHLLVGVASMQGTRATLQRPLQATQTIDVSSVLLPTVTVDGGAWSVDSSGDMTGAWLATHYQWQLPSPTGGAVVNVHVYSDTAVPGAIPDVSVPDAQYRPIGGLIDRRVRLLGFGELDRAGVLANIDELASEMTVRINPYLPSTSFATNGLP
jgi:hypothetical protein